MILKLLKMELDRYLIIHIIWISGKRMTAQGTNGISRVDLSSGVMGGEGGGKFLKYLRLNKTVLERQKGLKENLLLWVAEEWQVVTTEYLFNEVFTSPTTGWIWYPLPVLTKVAVKQLCLVQYFYPYSKHIFFARC